MIGNIAAGIYGTGAPPVAPSSYESISTVTLSSSASSITFSSIPSTYKHLQIRCLAKGTGSAGEDRYSAEMRFNSDTSSNYAAHHLAGNGSTVFAGSSTSATRIITAGRNWIPNSWSGYANIYGVAIMDILDYTSTTKAKTLRTLAGYNANTTDTTGNNISLTSGLWFKTPEAITSIDIICDNSQSFIAGSTFALYGIKD